MKTVKQTILGFALSVFSLTAAAQCPTSVSVTVLSNNANGDLTVSQVYGIGTPTYVNNYYTLANTVTSYAYSYGSTGSATFYSVPTGTYNLCVFDSINNNNCPTISSCMLVNITNTVVAPPTPTNCPSWSNTSVSIQYGVNGNVTTTANYLGGVANNASFQTSGSYVSGSNPATYNYATNGNYNIGTTYNEANCPSFMRWDSITVINSGTVTPAVCNASFYTYLDSLTCQTHFINTSTGNFNYSSWNINGTWITAANPIVSLANGTYPNIQLYNYFNNANCDSVSQTINVNCNNGGTVTPTGCQVNSSFVIFGDSLNTGNYFAYNTATGNGTLSYLWNFGDGTTSTQAYPFHQYATPGSYIVCLTTTSQTGTVSCSSSTCDSSSVQRTMAGFVMSQLNVLSAPTAVKVNATAIKNISAFPNPMTEVLNIEVELTANVNSLTCTIIDAVGKVISVNDLKDSKTTINTSSLDKGFYFLTITTDNGKAVKTLKLVK